MGKVVSTVPLNTWITEHTIRNKVSVPALEAWIIANKRDENGIVDPPPPPPDPVMPLPMGPDATGYEMVFEDMFASIDTDVWNLNLYGKPGETTQADLDFAFDPANVSIQNGRLELKAEKRKVIASNNEEYEYVAGCIECKNSNTWGYGIYEIAFQVSDKDAGFSINIMNSDLSIEICDSTFFVCESFTINDMDRINDSERHVFTVKITELGVDLFQDGVLVLSTIPFGTEPQFYIMMHNGIHLSNKPVLLNIEYVRVWELAS